MDIAKQTKLFLIPGISLTAILATMWWFGGDILNYGIWYDKIMHFFGGAGSCVLACLIAINLPDRWRNLLFRAGLPFFGRASAIFFGGLWECAEAAFPAMTSYISQGSWDTAFDLCADYIGGHIAGKIYDSIREKFPWRPAASRPFLSA